MKCLAPWTNIDISPGGVIKPCCKFTMDHYNVSYNLRSNTLEDYVNSEFLNGIKQELASDKFPDGCERCRIDEHSNIESKRQLDYKRWKTYYDIYSSNDGFITASIAFGNTCNLSCIMCSPKSSSKWRNEWKELYGVDIPNTRDLIDDAFIKSFKRLSPNLVHVDIPGGEPFLSQIDKQKALLSYYVSSGQSNKMTLHYTTNAQVFPDQEFWELWKHFKEIDIQLSIDGLEEQYEYIRYPASWNTMLNLIDRYIKLEQSLTHLRISVSHTVSAYNVYYLDEFFAWCEHIGLPKPYTGRVHYPTWLRPEILNHQEVIAKLVNSKRSEVTQWAQVIVDNNANIKEFIRRTQQHDEYRGNNFNKTFPELVNILEEIKNDN